MLLLHYIDIHVCLSSSVHRQIYHHITIYNHLFLSKDRHIQLLQNIMIAICLLFLFTYNTYHGQACHTNIGKTILDFLWKSNNYLKLLENSKCLCKDRVAGRDHHVNIYIRWFSRYYQDTQNLVIKYLQNVYFLFVCHFSQVYNMMKQITRSYMMLFMIYQ